MNTQADHVLKENDVLGREGSIAVGLLMQNRRSGSAHGQILENTTVQTLSLSFVIGIWYACERWETVEGAGSQCIMSLECRG